MILDLAKSVPIESEIARRGIKLIGRGPERCGPCPHCGGRDRFSINVTKGLFNCRGCSGRGDVIDLVQFLDRVDHRTACRMLAGSEMANPRSVQAGQIEGQNKPIERAKAEADKNSERALELWHNARGITGTIAEVYLRGRKITDIPGSEVIRILSGCPFDGTRQVCLIAPYRNVITNAPQAISRTAIDCAGNKVRRLTLGSTKGAAIKIDDDANVEYGLTIGEGTRDLPRRPSTRVQADLVGGQRRRHPRLPGVARRRKLVDPGRSRQAGR